MTEPLPISWCSFVRALRVEEGQVDAFADPDKTVGDAVKNVAAIIATKHDNLGHRTFAAMTTVACEIAEHGLDPVALNIPGTSANRSSLTLTVRGSTQTKPAQALSTVLSERNRSAPVVEPYKVPSDRPETPAEKRSRVDNLATQWRRRNDVLGRIPLGSLDARQIGIFARPLLDDGARAIGVIPTLMLFGGIALLVSDLWAGNHGRIRSVIRGVSVETDQGEQHLDDRQIILDAHQDGEGNENLPTFGVSFENVGGTPVMTKIF